MIATTIYTANNVAPHPTTDYKKEQFSKLKDLFFKHDNSLGQKIRLETIKEAFEKLGTGTISFDSYYERYTYKETISNNVVLLLQCYIRNCSYEWRVCAYIDTPSQSHFYGASVITFISYPTLYEETTNSNFRDWEDITIAEKVYNEIKTILLND